MNLTETRKGDVAVVAAAGRIDHQSAEAFQTALTPYLDACKADGDPLVIDMADVEYVSSVGLRVLLTASKQAAAQKGKIAVAAMQPTVGEVFRISQFHRIISAHDTVDEAVAALNS